MTKVINRCILYSLVLAGLLASPACDKGFLDEKPSTDIVQPATLDDFENLLDNTEVINKTSALPVISSDEYTYISYPVWQSAFTATERNAYIWAPDLYEGEVDPGNWSAPYASIFYANNVLEGLDRVTVVQSNRLRWNAIRGWALFVRAFAYFDLVKNFSPAFDEATADTDLGVPLRLSASVDVLLPRPSVRSVYDQILADLTTSAGLLDASLPAVYRNRPSKMAAFALLARVCLSMRRYTEAERYAGESLALYSKLIDYNQVSTSSATPFSITNDESILGTTSITGYNASAVYANSLISISEDLLNSYEANDLRLSIYFSSPQPGVFIMKRNYYGLGLYPYSGLATDELYLIKAECAARRNDAETALSWLNALLVKRYKTGSFVPLAGLPADEALDRVLLERRKELVWRGLRWDDLKRLNREGRNIALSRTLNGQTYTLPSNSSRYVFPIPDNEITLSGIEQNERVHD